MIKQYLINTLFFISIIFSWIESCLWFEILQSIELTTRSGRHTIAESICVSLFVLNIYSIYKFLIRRVKIHKFNLMGAIFFNIYVLLWIVIKKYFNDYDYLKFIIIPFAVYSVKWFFYKDESTEHKED